jgi:hypothetical protein
MAKRQPRAAFDHFAGYHSFVNESGEAYGSFEVYYISGTTARIAREAQRASGLDRRSGGDEPDARAGWYWHACFPGCMPDGEPSGPYTSSRAAWRAARED